MEARLECNSYLLGLPVAGIRRIVLVFILIIKHVTESVRRHVTFFVHPTGWKRCVTLRPYSTPWDGQNPAHFPPHVDKIRVVPDFFHPVGATVNVTVKSMVKSTTTQQFVFSKRADDKKFLKV